MLESRNASLLTRQVNGSEISDTTHLFVSALSYYLYVGMQVMLVSIYDGWYYMTIIA